MELGDFYDDGTNYGRIFGISRTHYYIGAYSEKVLPGTYNNARWRAKQKHVKWLDPWHKIYYAMKIPIPNNKSRCATCGRTNHVQSDCPKLRYERACEIYLNI